MAKKFTYKGKTAEELQAMPFDEVLKLLPSRARRTMKRMCYRHKALLEKIRKKRAAGKPIKVHERDMVILPEMVGLQFGVHNGKQFVPVEPTVEMIGHRLGDYSNPCTRGVHSGPGIGATRGSKHVALK